MNDRTDEETLEIIKTWWNENGATMLVTVVVVAAGVFGWRWWQDTQVAERAAAAELYGEFEVAASALLEDGIDADGELATTARHLAGRLRDEHPGSGYAAHAALALARAAVAADDFDRAAQHLQWVLDGGYPETLNDIARLRLARVRLAQEQYDAALALLGAVKGAGFVSEAQELTGDVHLERGDRDLARGAYQAALDAAREVAGGPVNRPFLQMKLDDLGTNS